MKKRQPTNISIGSSTMLLIFVVLSLVSFAVLSLSSAITDKNFTDKIKTKNISYYNACNLAEEQLGALDAKLMEAYASSPDEAAYFQTVSEGTLITVPVSNYQQLQLYIRFLYPLHSGDSFYEISSYSLVNTSTPELEDHLSIIQ